MGWTITRGRVGGRVEGGGNSARMIRGGVTRDAGTRAWVRMGVQEHGAVSFKSKTL